MSSPGDAASAPRSELRVVGTTVAREIELLLDRVAQGIGKRAPRVLQVGSRSLVSDRNERNWRGLIAKRFAKGSHFVGVDLFEGTNVSEGRGTTRPFEIVGAPWIAAEPFAARLNQRSVPGAVFRPAVFEPTFHKHAKQTCGGCQIHVVDRTRFAPVFTGVLLIQAIRDALPHIRDEALAAEADRLTWLRRASLGTVARAFRRGGARRGCTAASSARTPRRCI